MRCRMNCYRILCLGLFCAGFLAGCGGGDGPRGTVTGKVSLAGSADAAGCKVVFVNEESGTAGTGIVQSDGTYAIKHKGSDGIPVGSYKISVTPPAQEMSDDEYSKYMDASEAERQRIDAQKAETEKLVSAKYRDPKTSGLTFDVKEGSQTFDIELE